MVFITQRFVNVTHFFHRHCHVKVKDYKKNVKKIGHLFKKLIAKATKLTIIGIFSPIFLYNNLRLQFQIVNLIFHYSLMNLKLETPVAIYYNKRG